VFLDVIQEGQDRQFFEAIRDQTFYFSERTDGLMMFALFGGKLFYATEAKKFALQRQQIADFFGRQTSIASKLRSADWTILEFPPTGVTHQVPVVALEKWTLRRLN
jgi:hypothetical protein